MAQETKQNEQNAGRVPVNCIPSDEFYSTIKQNDLIQ